jgi:hypothetical protein
LGNEFVEVVVRGRVCFRNTYGDSGPYSYLLIWFRKGVILAIDLPRLREYWSKSDFPSWVTALSFAGALLTFPLC